MRKMRMLALLCALLLALIQPMAAAASAFDYSVWKKAINYTNVSDGVCILGAYYDYEPDDSGEIILPSQIYDEPVVSIGEYAFKGRVDLTRVTIPGSVKKIANGAFDEAPVLTRVTIEDGVTEIGHAFRDCPMLATVEVPASVTSIADLAFVANGEFFHLTVEKGSYAEEFAKKSGLAYSYDSEAFDLELEVGNTVVFGELDGMPVQWLVLEVNEGEALLLSKDILETRRYSVDDQALWKSSEMNEYLNGELIYRLFDGEDAELINVCKVYDPASPYSFSGLSGRSDFCAMFLLSYFEARDLLPTDELRAASAEWWLRTSRDYSEYTHCVGTSGSIGSDQITNSLGVRPALWIRTDGAADCVKVVDRSVWTFEEESAGEESAEAEDDGVFGVGDLFTFGSYEQDNNLANGAEPISWRVVRMNGTQATMITQYCIDVRRYNESEAAINWGDTTLRAWLNGEFIDTAFTAEEQAALIETEVQNYDSDNAAGSYMYSSMVEPAVSYDRVWIPSKKEADSWMPNLEDELAYPTAYVSAKGVAGNNEGYAQWMLRTDKSSRMRVNIMFPYQGGLSVVMTNTVTGIRPVVKVDLAVLGIMEPVEENYVLDWANPYSTITSRGSGDPSQGTRVTEDLLGKALKVENRVGGWFRMVAPRDGDYVFSVLADDVSYDYFSTEVYLDGQHVKSFYYLNSSEIQTATLRGVQEGQTITWWDSTPKGSTLTMDFVRMVEVTEAGTAGEDSVDRDSVDRDSVIPKEGFITPQDGDTVEAGQALTLEWYESEGADSYYISVYSLSEYGKTLEWSKDVSAVTGLTTTIPRSTLTEPSYCIELSARRQLVGDAYGELFKQSIEINVHNKFEQAEEETSEAGGTSGAPVASGDFLYYPQSDGTCILSNYTGTGSLAIPETIDGYTVTAIADGACYWSSGLTSVSIPGTVKTIGANAFAWCFKLNSVTMAEGVQEIGDGAFGNDSELRSIDFADSVTRIGSYVCSDCTKLEQAALPAQLTELGESAFSSCEMLHEVVVPAGVKVIPDSAFFGCIRLSSLQLSEGLTEICGLAFYGCEKLTSVVIPDTVTAIGEWAFSYCVSLSNLTLPDGAAVGEGAFSGCAL